MERLVKSGKISDVYYARLIPGEDILQAIYELCVKYDIRTGIILDGSGAGVDFTYQHFPMNKAFLDPKLNVVVATMEGKCEMSLQGTIGTTVVKLPEGKNADEVIDSMYPTIPGYLETVADKWHMLGSMGGDGTPYVHAHCTASNKDATVCGHLMPGTKVGSGNPELPSHFTIVIAKITGIEWQAVLPEEFLLSGCCYNRRVSFRIMKQITG